jgi:hypothetical protein
MWHQAQDRDRIGEEEGRRRREKRPWKNKETTGTTEARRGRKQLLGKRDSLKRK